MSRRAAALREAAARCEGDAARWRSKKGDADTACLEFAADAVGSTIVFAATVKSQVQKTRAPLPEFGVIILDTPTLNPAHPVRPDPSTLKITLRRPRKWRMRPPCSTTPSGSSRERHPPLSLPSQKWMAPQVRDPRFCARFNRFCRV